MQEKPLTSVILDVRVGERICVGDRLVVQLMHKSGLQSRLRVSAPRELSIKKQEEPATGVVPSMATSHR